MLPRKSSDSAIRRLAIYLRFLEEFGTQGQTTVSSGALAARAGTTSAQVRKDLSLFGSFGKRGIGYEVQALTAQLRQILGLGRRYRVMIVGAGRLAGALVQFNGFRQRGFDTVALVDRDTGRIGQQVGGMLVEDVADLEAIVKRESVDMAIIVTPADPAQEVVDRLVAAGVTAILNFAPVQLNVPEGVDVKNVNLAVELETLSYRIAHREGI